MKILLTTIVDNVNIGTYLQAYATVRTLQQMGHEVTVLNYERRYLFGREYAMKLWKDKPFLVRWLFSYYYLFQSWLHHHKKGKDFLRRNQIVLTKAYDTLEKVRQARLQYDLYMVGSDQVWNTRHHTRLDEVYFLTFTEGKKVAYAASIGMDSIPDVYKSVFKQRLFDFTAISVREASAVKMLNELGFNDVQLVLDPTLMLSKEEWLRAAGDPLPNIPSDYLLIYSVEKSQQTLVEEVAKKIATGRGLTICWIISSDAPERFLQLFAHASYLVVSSFHGTAFAINFSKQFVSVAPEKFNTRVQDLLQLAGLEDRYVSDVNQIPKNSIDYQEVAECLNTYRRHSKEFLSTFVK